jgi:hypothetical protein
MTDMIERVAKAIDADRRGWALVPPEGATDENRWKTYTPIARAAIAAMRDCTPEMLDAGSAAHPAGGYRRETLLNDIIECEWVAMVDAALECSTKPDEK